MSEVVKKVARALWTTGISSDYFPSEGDSGARKLAFDMARAAIEAYESSLTPEDIERLANKHGLSVGVWLG